MDELESKAPILSAAFVAEESERTAASVELAASVIREFFIDFLGSLVPGFLFTMFAVPMVLWTGAVVYVVCQELWHFQIANINSGSAESLAVQAVFSRYSGYKLFSLILVIAYVLGCVFCRRDPKVPDQRSVGYILWKDWECMDRAAVQPLTVAEKEEKAELDKKKLPKNGLLRLLRSWNYVSFTKKLAEGAGGQFPYSHLHEYLTARGLNHLAHHVPWKGRDGEISKRSKMFINVLKIRIEHWNRQHCGDIVRNEAHIRMMSSIWYAARYLQNVYIALFLLLVLGAYLLHRAGLPNHGVIVWTTVAILATLIFAVEWVRREILTFLHYQRVREIVYVLETAHVFWRQGYKDIFEGFKEAVAHSGVTSLRRRTQSPRSR